MKAPRLLSGVPERLSDYLLVQNVPGAFSNNASGH
jgi:hypothetical protein